MTTKLNPYLGFRDNAREAMEFYHSVFGGELDPQHLRRAPRQRGPGRGRQDHARDAGHRRRPDADGGGHPELHGLHPRQQLLGVAQRRRTTPSSRLLGEALDGGTVTMPLEKAPWGDSFGMCVDKFGITWMVNIAGMPQGRDTVLAATG